MSSVIGPIVHDVKNLGPNDATQDYQNTEVPGVVWIDALFLGIAHADPQPDQHSQGNQETIGGQVKFFFGGGRLIGPLGGGLGGSDQNGIFDRNFPKKR